jgi:hypothetical protein
MFVAHRTRQEVSSPADASPDTQVTDTASERRCLGCGSILTTSRSTARCCSAACRTRVSRDRRRVEILTRLEASERALRAAADDLRDYRAFLEANIGKAVP